MNEAQNINLSLLSQKEIDTLVAFLLDKKKSVNSSVLSQSSIDKLIELIRYNSDRKRENGHDTIPDIDGSLAELVTIRETEEQLCELQIKTDTENGKNFCKMFVHNTVNGKDLAITPALICKEEEIEDWGRCISPALFCKLARALNVKYSAQTYDAVCQGFAECVYGDAQQKLPSLYLPDNDVMIRNLI